MRRAMLMMGPQPMLPHIITRWRWSTGMPNARLASSLRTPERNIRRTGMPQARSRSGVMPPPRKSPESDAAGMK